jgi:cell division protein FtsL
MIRFGYQNRSTATPKQPKMAAQQHMVQIMSFTNEKTLYKIFFCIVLVAILAIALLYF